ncbi:MAG: hypothetical protein LC808_27505, partial [Actinobacteria bacterium]|nr:hypothetical protein [Actinomycetota bacterium]
LITHARTGAARFLGYEITVQHNDRQLTRGQRHVNGHIALRVCRRSSNSLVGGAGVHVIPYWSFT